MKNIIYGLSDSRNDLIYYVGKTTVGKSRPLQHLTNSHSPEVNKWKEEIESNWGHVKVVLIEEVSDILLLSEREKYWIGVHSISNENLLNKQDLPVFISTYNEDDDIRFSELKNTVLFVGDIIKKRRLALNVTQSKLAKESNLNRWTISKVESGGDIALSSLKKIILGLTSLEIGKHIIDNRITERVRKY